MRYLFTNIAVTILICTLPLVSQAEAGKTPVSVQDSSQVVHWGSKMRGFYGLDEKLQKIWVQVKEFTGLDEDHKAPKIYLRSFEEDKLDPEFRQWQKEWTRNNFVIWQDWFNADDIEITQEWIDENIDDIYPFPKTFLAFHYDKSNVIQINPTRTFYKFYQVDPYGQARDMVGFGYYSAAHEMLHYALEQAGVKPTHLHHCLYLRPTQRNPTPIMEQLADFLVETGIADKSVKRYGFEPELYFDPCSKLSESELAEVDAALERLPAR